MRSTRGAITAYFQDLVDFKVRTVSAAYTREKINTQRASNVSDDIILSHLLYEPIYFMTIKFYLQSYIKTYFKYNKFLLPEHSKSLFNIINGYLNEQQRYYLDHISFKKHEEHEDNINERRRLFLAGELLKITSLDEIQFNVTFIDKTLFKNKK